MSHNGCPTCGSERLKAAPVFAVDALRGALDRRRRYRCSACGWSGWKHRLKRRSSGETNLTPNAAPAGRAVWFALVVVAVLAVSGAMFTSSCQERSEIGGAP